jgi:hypothetical protein
MHYTSCKSSTDLSPSASVAEIFKIMSDTGLLVLSACLTLD